MIEKSQTDLHKNTFSPVIRFIAHLLSFVFHPVFIPVYVTSYLLYGHPLLFASFSGDAKIKLLLIIIFNLTFLPAFAVFLCWRLKFVTNLFLNTQKERIIPYALAMIFYFWGWYVMHNLPDIPELFKQFMFGSFLTVIAAWLCNIYFKISMHALALGGMVFFVLMIAQTNEGASGQWLSLAILVAGAVSTSRLIVSNHHPAEIYSGLLFGAFCQQIAAWL